MKYNIMEYIIIPLKAAKMSIDFLLKKRKKQGQKKE